MQTTTKTFPPTAKNLLAKKGKKVKVLEDRERAEKLKIPFRNLPELKTLNVPKTDTNQKYIFHKFRGCLLAIGLV